MKSIGPALMFFAFAGIYIAVLFFRYKKHAANLGLIRSSIELGRPLDTEVVNKLIQPQPIPASSPMRAVLAFRIASTLIFAMGIGLPILGYFLVNVDPNAFPALQGTGGLFVCISIGLFAASKLVQNKVKSDQSA